MSSRCTWQDDRLDRCCLEANHSGSHQTWSSSPPLIDSLRNRGPEGILTDVQLSTKALCEQIAELEAEKRELELKYRDRLWKNHGCRFESLYGDDGEMECNECGLDFKGAPIEELEKKLTDRAFAKYEEDKARLAACGNIPDLDKDIDVHERLTTMGMALDVERHEHANTRKQIEFYRERADHYKDLAEGATACVETGQKWMESDGKKLETLRAAVNAMSSLLLSVYPYARYRLKCVEEDCGYCGGISEANEATRICNELDDAVEAIRKGSGE